MPSRPPVISTRRLFSSARSASGPVGGTVQAAWLDGTELYFLAP